MRCVFDSDKSCVDFDIPKVLVELIRRACMFMYVDACVRPVCFKKTNDELRHAAITFSVLHPVICEPWCGDREAMRAHRHCLVGSLDDLPGEKCCLRVAWNYERICLAR